MGLRARRRGVSALFDAVLFFVMVSAASAGLSLATSRALSPDASQDAAVLGAEQAREIHHCALACTIGPVTYRLGGEELSFEGSALEAVSAVLESCNASGSDASALQGELARLYDLLVELPYEHALFASTTGPAAELFTSGEAGGPGDIPDQRWTCSVPLVAGGEEGEVTLYLWR